MSSGIKMCPFRKVEKVYTEFERLISYEEDKITTTETAFLPCLYDMCMAYEKGMCYMIHSKNIEEYLK